MNAKTHCALIAAVLTALSVPAHARLGLRAQFSDDVVMENVELGKSYNLRTMGHLPYIVTNAGDSEVDIAVEVTVPGEATKSQLKPGYEPLIDPGWVQIVPNKYHLKPGEQGISEIIVSIPDDKAYLNKSYQFSVWSHSVNTGLMGTGVEHRLRFSIGKGPETLLAEKKQKAMMSLDFDVTPSNLYLVGVDPGKHCDLKSDKGLSLKLTNRGGTAIKVKPISAKFAMGINPFPGYEKAPDPSWLTFKPDMIKVSGMSIKEVKLFLSVPEDQQYYGKKYAFLVKFELQGTEVPLEVYNQVLVTVAEKK